MEREVKRHAVGHQAAHVGGTLQEELDAREKQGAGTMPTLAGEGSEARPANERRGWDRQAWKVIDGLVERASFDLTSMK
jgi:hypothetical protein